MLKKILIVLSIMLVLGLMWSYESTYARQAIITNSENGIVTVQDNCGYIWEYNGSATVGDSITLVMYDNHTSNIDDDVVKEVRQQ